MAKIVKLRADQLVFEQGLAESREQAKRLIMAGRVNLAPGQQARLIDGRELKPGQSFAVETRFELVQGKVYASRGAYKLLSLIEHFALDVTGLVCLDIGASTGGFTDCLLQHGAQRVYAIDVGHNQLHEKLRNDPRVVSLEGVNVRYAQAELVPELTDLLVGDVSFISLTMILPACIQWLKTNAKLAVLIKPQFELGPNATVKGVVKDEKARLQAVENVVSFCHSNLGLSCAGVVPAAIKGPKGNQEYMALFERIHPYQPS